MSFFEALIDDILEDDKTPPASPTTENSEKDKNIVNQISNLSIGGNPSQVPATSSSPVPKSEASATALEPKQAGLMEFIEALGHETDSKPGSAPVKDESFLDKILGEFDEEDKPDKPAAAPPKDDALNKKPKSDDAKEPEGLGDKILRLFEDDSDDE